jgi:hypothetical protein
LPGGNPVDDTDTGPGTGQDDAFEGQDDTFEGQDDPFEGQDDPIEDIPSSDSPNPTQLSLCDTTKWAGFCEPWMYEN